MGPVYGAHWEWCSGRATLQTGKASSTWRHTTTNFSRTSPLNSKNQPDTCMSVIVYVLRWEQGNYSQGNWSFEQEDLALLDQFIASDYVDTRTKFEAWWSQAILYKGFRWYSWFPQNYWGSNPGEDKVWARSTITGKPSLGRRWNSHPWIFFALWMADCRDLGGVIQEWSSTTAESN